MDCQRFAGVTDYDVLYGDINGTTTNTMDLGNVTSTVISGLTSGETYFVSIIRSVPTVRAVRGHHPGSSFQQQRWCRVVG